jgi:hypothetical protein
MTSTNNGGNWDAAPRLINMVGNARKFRGGWERTFGKRLKKFDRDAAKAAKRERGKR